MDVHVQSIDRFLAGYHRLDRDRAMAALHNNQSVCTVVEGKRLWINPDGTLTHAPKAEIRISLDDDTA